MGFRRVLASIVFVLACFFAGFVTGAPNEYSPCKNAHTANQTSIGLAAKTEESSTKNADDSDCDPPHWYAAFKRPDGMLVLVGIATFIVIAWQAWETRRAAQDMQRSVEIQEVPLRQWLLFPNWGMDLADPLNDATTFKVWFDILNETSYPLTIKRVWIQIFRQPVYIHDRYVLAPKRSRRYATSTRLTQEQLQKRRDGVLDLIVVGNVVFEGVLKGDREVVWPLTGILRCSTVWTEFRPEHIAIHNEKNNPEAN